MPCNSDHLEHNAWEAESGRVLEFLKEVQGQTFDHDHPDYYGHTSTLAADTRALCDWCQAHDVTKMSLELQLWWKRHQAADRTREEREAEAARVQAVRDRALGKLTPEEIEALKTHS